MGPVSLTLFVLVLLPLLTGVVERFTVVCERERRSRSVKCGGDAGLHTDAIAHVAEPRYTRNQIISQDSSARNESRTVQTWLTTRQIRPSTCLLAPR